MNPRLIFVGQAPNKESWRRGLALGRKIARRKGDLITLFATEYSKQFAERYCKRLALTGRVGGFLARVLGVDAREFRRRRRVNLNARFTGKAGKGDKFNEAEARNSATGVHVCGFTDVVLLGRAGAKAFKLGHVEFLKVYHQETPTGPVRYIVVPHPSGINQWWNSKSNTLRAKRALRRFVRESDVASRADRCIPILVANGPLQGTLVPRSHQVELSKVFSVNVGARVAIYRQGVTPGGRPMLKGGSPLYFFDRWLDGMERRDA